MRELPTVKRALNWMWNHADTIGIGCMWVGAVLSMFLRDTQRACTWAMFAIVCTVQNRHRAELDRLRIEANVTRELLDALTINQAQAAKGLGIWTDNVNALHLKIDRVEGAMLKQRN